MRAASDWNFFTHSFLQQVACFSDELCLRRATSGTLSVILKQKIKTLMVALILSQGFSFRLGPGKLHTDMRRKPVNRHWGSAPPNGLLTLFGQGLPHTAVWKGHGSWTGGCPQEQWSSPDHHLEVNPPWHWQASQKADPQMASNFTDYFSANFPIPQCMR